ncbi:MAG: hypothetical protein H7Y27_00620 [Gemmatimonadaceae bacterium]|nr:hypothetical protein [Chitinophagaceae bacterium]
MIKTFWQRNWQHFASIAILLFVSVIYCKPAVEGMVLDQHDVQGWKGMAQQSVEFREKNGHYPYWTNSMFSGMPGYQIAFETPNKISIGVLHNNVFTLGLPKPINFFFLACLTFYFLLMVLKINPWIGVMGAISYAYASYDPVIVGVGHDTKMICIGYAPAVIGSLILLFDRKYIMGTALTALSAAMIVWQNHIQVTYYTMIIALCLAIAFAVHQFRTGNWKPALISGGLALLAAGIALGVNTINLWPMNEYASETMRGGRSELTDTSKSNNKTKGGLPKDYAFAYSVGKLETFTFIVPRIYGGRSPQVVNNEYKNEWGKTTKAAEVLSERTGMNEDQASDFVKQFHAYWGEQLPTAGPVYLGAIVCFLFILGMVYLKSWHKWWLFAASVIGVFLAWGKNLEGFNYFLFDYLPFYNKFRAPSMALIIPQLTFPVLACLALNQFLFSTEPKKELWKKLKLTGYITGGVFAILAMLYLSFDYSSEIDQNVRQGLAQNMGAQMAAGQQPTPQIQQQADEFGKAVVNAIQSDRQSLFGADLLRSFILIGLAFALLALYTRDKLKTTIVIAGFVLLGCFDILGVATRYLNYGNFAEPSEVDAVFTLTEADRQIQADPEKNVRVFDQASGGDPFQSSTASYHHNSIGGYSPAKLALYEDLKIHQLQKGNMNVFNMLNTKYFIVQDPATGKPVAQLNPSALGNAWFVKGFRFAKNADEEMKALDNLNTRDSAVIDERYKSNATTQPQYDSTATIRLKSNEIDKIIYESKAGSNQFAVFSEIYYPHGWDAYIDGKKTEHIRVNYLLRGMYVPAGQHTIEFRFEPHAVIVGDKMTMWFSILLYLLLIAAIVLQIRKNKNRTA